MSVVEFEGRRPRVHESAFLAPGSWVIGEVTIGEGVNVWTGAVIRGDDDTVEIGARTTVLENCVIEAPTGYPVAIGEDTVVSHGAVVHGARIGSGVLVGIGAIVLDGAEVGDGAIVGSGALVPLGAVVPPNQLAIGLPAKPLREVREEERLMVAREHERTASKAERYKAIYANE
jgi:carbonic anhydrase/acetyltransferase-like protein (isoleucine patch superfamily)